MGMDLDSEAQSTRDVGGTNKKAPALAGAFCVTTLELRVLLAVIDEVTPEVVLQMV